MVASEGYAEFLREQLAPLGRVTMRRMFGKTGVFCDGVMLGMVTENTLYFRVDDDNRVTFKEAESFPPLNYAKGGSTIDLSFWRVPERLFDEPDELVTWARIALAAARVGPDGFERVHTVRIGSDWTREIKRLQTFGRLVNRSAEAGPVFVDAPQTWRQVAGSAAGPELEWLEEDASVPLTTLQRLGRLRRSAA